MQGSKSGLLLIALLAGCLASPTSLTTKYEFEDLFYHTEQATRIVGGTPAPEGSAPYMAVLSTGVLIRSLLCGGSVITARTILTAAHCIDAAFSFGALLSSLRVTVGTNRWNSGGQTYSFQRNVTHAHYVSPIIKNDIGVLITTSNIVFSNTVLPVQINYNFVDAGVAVRAAGWGRIRQGGAISAALLDLYMSTIDGNRCAIEVPAMADLLNMRGVPHVEPHIEVCTYHSPGHGMCNGDSGSALVRTDSGQQIGLVSWGLPCALGAPDMFVRISAYRDWLLQHVV